LADEAGRRKTAARHSARTARGEGPAGAAQPARGPGTALTLERGWQYAPAPESREIVTIEPEYGLFVGGEFAPGESGRTFATVNPATEEPLADVALASAADVDRAVAAARNAYEKTWGKMPGSERAKYLYRIARILQERSREFAVLESIDNGKPIRRRATSTSRSLPPLLLLRRLGRQVGVRGIRAGSATDRRRRPGHPVEFPALDGGVEAGPCPGGREHLRAEAR
jgi:hypothetical protein